MSKTVLRPFRRMKSADHRGVGARSAGGKTIDCCAGRAITATILICQASYLRCGASPHAHARLGHIDIGTASKLPGVHAVLTGADYVADGIADIGHVANPAGAVDWQKPAFVNRDGSAPFDVAQPTVVREKVRHVGEVVAVVVADTDAIARDAADLAVVAYETLPVVTDALKARTRCPIDLG